MNYLQTLVQYIFPTEDNNFRPHLLESRVFFYLVVAVLMVKMITVVMYLPFPQNFFFADLTKIDLVHLLNQARAQSGLPQLTENAKLNQAAYLKAQDMVQKNYFAHQSPQGITPWYWFLQANYNYTYAGENLAIGFVDSPDVVRAWLNSPSHKANMVNPKYTEVGTAVLDGFGSSNSVVVVQLFGTEAKQVPAATTAPTKPSPKPAPLPEPVITTQASTNPSPTSQAPPNVLSYATENLSYTKPVPTSHNAWYLRLLNFVVYQNSRVIEVIAYVLLAIIGTCLFGYVIVSFRELEHRLIMKPLVMIALIATTLLVSPELFTAAFSDHILILA